MPRAYRTGGLGWLPDYPDFRDYTIQQDEVPTKLKRIDDRPVSLLRDQLKVQEEESRELPKSVDLRQHFPPIEDQGQIGSCTAQAAVALIEYFERRAFGKHLDASRLFLYKVTRNLLNLKGDTGAFLRSAMGALVLFGVPPEEYWAYDEERFDEEPPAFCYAFAQSYQAIQYYRLDPPATPKEALLDRIKQDLAAGLPSMFGFTVFSSISEAATSGEIPWPAAGEKIVGGHAVVAAGYDNTKKIKVADADEETEGAILIRNSWGTGWGEEGYGWLSYSYVLKGLAEDWWSLLKGEWVDTGAFGDQ